MARMCLAGRLFAALLTLCLGACVSDGSWAYTPAAPRVREPVLDATLVVLPLSEWRDNENTNVAILCHWPLVPWGWMDYSRPEDGWSLRSEIDRLQDFLKTRECHDPENPPRLSPYYPLAPRNVGGEFRPKQDFASAIASEIEAARIFRAVYNADERSSGDYRLTGELRSTHYHARVITYGLTIIASYLWLAGFPMATVENEIEIRLILTQAGSATPLWSHTIRRDAWRVLWLYAPGTDFMYPEILKEAMPEALASLEQALASKR